MHKGDNDDDDDDNDDNNNNNNNNKLKLGCNRVAVRISHVKNMNLVTDKCRFK